MISENLVKCDLLTKSEAQENDGDVEKYFKMLQESVHRST